MNPLMALKPFGQSVWLDYIERDLIEKGGLAKLIENDGLAGVTSNPSIFHQAIAKTGQYDAVLTRLAREGASARDMYFTLVLEDIRAAADVLRSVYDATNSHDGYVSLEVSPHLAHDTAGTIEQAEWLWEQVGRPNLMIKVPGTRAGLPAIEHLIAAGINVNVTLLFSVPRYEEVTQSWLAGLETRARQSLPLERIASVASFFLSRIDSMVDDALEDAGDDAPRGKVAIASAKAAYRHYERMLDTPRWKRLAQLGAQPQRLLWASTSTKNPDYSDVLYVDSLVGPDTVNTLPPKTLEAYRDHGEPAARLGEDLQASEAALAALPRFGVDLADIATRLEEQGVQKFVDSFDALMAALKERRERLASA